MAGIYTIAPTAPFLDVLVEGVLQRYGHDALALSRVQILLPTRRACSALRDAFLRSTNGAPMLLPRMTPLGDVDEDGVSLLTQGSLDLPPAMPTMRRLLMFTRMLLARGGDGSSPGQAALLARELAAFMDHVGLEGLPLDGLPGLVAGEYAEHWQKTLRFLDVVTAMWPDVVAAEGCIDNAVRRHRLLTAQADRWSGTPPSHPVIAAGSTGSVPATAALLKIIAALPEGHVVLPGLDRWAEDAASEDPTHPQYTLRCLLRTLDVAPEAVADWGSAPSNAPVAGPDRLDLARKIMQPAACVDWAREEPSLRGADGLSLLEFPSLHDEASAIALLMREALETPAKTAALVTPDRQLARRVSAELRRWGIEANDSAGTPLADTVPGAFFRLTAVMVANNFAAVPTLAALKHPLSAGGITHAAFRRQTRRLEGALLRGIHTPTGIDGLVSAARSRTPLDTTLVTFTARLEALARDFNQVMGADKISLDTVLRAHVAFAEALAASDMESGPERLWAGDEGEALALFVTNLAEATDCLEQIDPRSYPALIDALMAGEVTRPRHGLHPRISIWGTLEARLQRPDLMIMASLNEGVWPADADVDPWMSRPMRVAFGLPSPERKIGQAAHDFVQAMCAPEVVITRATRVDGAPSVRSRWLQRLIAYIGNPAVIMGRPEIATWIRAMDATSQPPCPIAPPRPCPPVSTRPRALSVTQVETLMRDPYAVYARHILRLRAIDPLNAAPSPADFGSIVHKAIETFQIECIAGTWPTNAKSRLEDMGREAFGNLLDHPSIWAFWWPRFLRIAEWFISNEEARRPGITATHVEIRGSLTLQAPAGEFTLSAKADRLDVTTDGNMLVIDYKTGEPPAWSEVDAGVAPQLPLEGAIALAGGFSSVGSIPVHGMEYWRLRGAVPAGQIHQYRGDTGMAVDAALVGLEALITRFDDPATSYPSQPVPSKAPRYTEYAHLARIQEWNGM